jgi:hypothetical protein
MISILACARNNLIYVLVTNLTNPDSPGANHGIKAHIHSRFSHVGEHLLRCSKWKEAEYKERAS